MRILIFLAGLCCSVAAWAERPVGFDESASDRLRVFTDTYELALSKSNGAIVALTDKTAKADLVAGSRNGCLWGSNYQGTPAITSAIYCGGCSFASDRPDSFTYNWNQGESTLTFFYKSAAGSTQHVEASVTLNFRATFFCAKMAGAAAVDRYEIGKP